MLNNTFEIASRTVSAITFLICGMVFFLCWHGLFVHQKVQQKSYLKDKGALLMCYANTTSCVLSTALSVCVCVFKTQHTLLLLANTFFYAMRCDVLCVRAPTPNTTPIVGGFLRMRRSLLSYDVFDATPVKFVRSASVDVRGSSQATFRAYICCVSHRISHVPPLFLPVRVVYRYISRFAIHHHQYS